MKNKMNILGWLLVVVTLVGYSGLFVFFRDFAPGENPYGVTKQNLMIGISLLVILISFSVMVLNMAYLPKPAVLLNFALCELVFVLLLLLRVQG